MPYKLYKGKDTQTIKAGDYIQVSFTTKVNDSVLFTTADVGRPKVEAAAERLKALNPHIRFEVFNTRLDSSNALELISHFDVVADGTDNFQTRYLVNDACVLAGKVNVFASIFRFEGQASVFNYRYSDGTRGPNYRDLFPTPPPPGLVPSCAEGGVLGVLPGILGSLQASEVIKVISGVGEPLVGRLFQFDAASFTTKIYKIAKDPDNPLTGTNATQTGLIDYDYFCGIHFAPKPKEEQADEIEVATLKEWIRSGKDFQLIDVREPFEYAIANIGGKLIPKNEIMTHIDQIDRNKDVVFLCKSGIRSRDVINRLRKEAGLTNLYNVTGGITAWAIEIDPSLPKY